MSISIEHKTAAGLAIVGLFLVLVSIITYTDARQSLADTRWIAHTHEVIAELNAAQAALDDWNTAANGYLLTGENSYLKSYRDSFSDLLGRVDHLKRLTVDNSAQQARIVVLHSQLMTLFGILDATVTSRHENGFEAARQKIVLGHGKPEMTAVRATIAEAKDEEQHLLTQREAQGQKTSRVAGVAFSSIVFLQLAMLGLIYATVRKDIRQRQLAAELLHESDERHRKLFDNNPHPTWVYDRDTLRFLAVNAAAVRKYGFSNDEFLAMSVKDIRPSEDVPALLESVAKIREETEHVSDWRHRRKDGSLLDVEITSYPLNFDNRRAEVVVAVDITEKKRADKERNRLIDSLAQANQQLEIRNREVEQATKLKSKFLASMSHELRTPLNAIVGFSGLIADGTGGPLSEKQKRFAAHIKTGAHHLLQLINDILDLSKVEAGQLEIRRDNFHVRDALPEVLSTIRPLAMA